MLRRLIILLLVVGCGIFENDGHYTCIRNVASDPEIAYDQTEWIDTVLYHSVNISNAISECKNDNHQVAPHHRVSYSCDCEEGIKW